MATTMSCKIKEKIKIEIEIGHWAKRISAAPAQPVLPNSAVQNATHVWKVWVCGRHGQLESFVERVVFLLHPTFPNPTRVVTRPPFEIEEKAFGTFPMKIELHFNDSMAGFEYEVFLMLDKDIHCKAIKSFAIANPRPPEFREKLIQAGGIVVDPSEDSPLGPTEVKPAKASKSSGSASGLVRHRSKAKSAASALLAQDEQSFASPASSFDDPVSAGHSLPQSPHPQHQALPPELAISSSRSIVGSRLASPSKAKLRESGGGGGGGGGGGFASKPRSQSQQPALAATVKPEPTTSYCAPPVDADFPPQQPAPPVARVAELRADEGKSEKLVLKISKSPIKYSPAPPVAPVATKTEPTVLSELPASEVYTSNPPPQLQQPPPQQSWSASSASPVASAAPPAMVAVVAPHVAMDAFKSSPLSVEQPQPPAYYSQSPSLAANWHPVAGAGGVPETATESEDDRRRRKKEKRKKEKHHRHHRDHHEQSDSDSRDAAERRRHEERRRHRHEAKEKKRRRRDDEADDSQAASSVLAGGAQLAAVDGFGVAEASQNPTAPPPPPAAPLQPQQPPPMLEAEPPMLSPYLQSAVVKEDPELMSQTSVESTGFRPAAADPPSTSASANSSPMAAASIPISAAAMAAESSALARHPKYQWSAQSGLSREEYDQRFQLCLLAASLEDPDRLQLLASVLAESEALTNRDSDYANFDLAKLRPDCVKRLAALLMPNGAS